MSVIETGTYTDFSLIVHGRAETTRVPVNGTIEVTDRCPLECKHCYNNLPMSDFVARAREMTLDEHKRLLDELAELGCLWLLFSGGEIFARRDFLDIYTYAKRKGFLITLFTNGTMITEKIADFLADMRPFTIEITLYGGTKETYEKVTGIPGSYDRCMRGVDLLLERKLPLKLKTVALSINKHEIPLMRQMAADRGCEFTFDAMINPRIDCSASPLAVRLKPSEIVELDLDNPERVSEWRRLARDHPSAPAVEGKPTQVYQCGGGINSFAVDPYGDLSICVLSHVDKYNVREGNFREGWEEYLLAVRRREITRPTKCTGCGLKSMCGMCAANGELENGDAESPVDFLCQVAHLRAETLDIPVPAHGDCEYCVGGSGHELVRVAAEALKSGEAERIAAIPYEPAERPAASGCGTGSCSSCSITSAVAL
ncbi:MAG TPA: radical SAM protein [Thermoanaerobaculia bacterium]